MDEFWICQECGEKYVCCDWYRGGSNLCHKEKCKPVKFIRKHQEGQIILQGVKLKDQPLKNILEIILFDAEKQDINIDDAIFDEPPDSAQGSQVLPQDQQDKENRCQPDTTSTPKGSGMVKSCKNCDNYDVELPAVGTPIIDCISEKGSWEECLTNDYANWKPQTVNDKSTKEKEKINAEGPIIVPSDNAILVFECVHCGSHDWTVMGDAFKIIEEIEKPLLKGTVTGIEQMIACSKCHKIESLFYSVSVNKKEKKE